MLQNGGGQHARATVARACCPEPCAAIWAHASRFSNATTLIERRYNASLRSIVAAVCDRRLEFGHLRIVPLGGYL